MLIFAAAIGAQAQASITGFAWALVTSPNVGSSSQLYGVAVVSASDVWAVGRFDAGTSTSPLLQTLTEHWDGSSWKIVSSPNAGLSGSILSGVAAVSSNNVWAVGYSSTYGTPQTLVENWDGASWHIIPSPVVQGGSSLESISVISQSDIWAVGLQASTVPGPTVATLAIHWDGSNWTIIPSPNVGNRWNSFEAIAVVSGTDIWAVGTWRDTGANYQTLIEHWDGTAWTVAPSPNTPYGSQLSAVGAVSSNDVWATGVGLDASAVGQPLFLHWNGVAWNTFQSPGGVSPCLGCVGGLAVVAANDIWAVGDDIAHWDGTSWSPIPSATVPGADTSGLTSVAQVSPTELWAVGRYFNTSGSFTLTEQLQPSTALAVSTISLNPANLVAGFSFTGTVTLNGPAPTGGATVSLKSGNAAVATLPSSVTVAAGSTSASFTATTNTVSSATGVTISASYGGLTAYVLLEVLPFVTISSFTLDPTSVTGGGTSTGTIVLSNQAPPGGAMITLTSSNTNVATVPSSVTIQSGGIAMTTFTVSTKHVSSTTQVTISASYNGVATATLTVLPSSTSTNTVSITKAVYVTSSGQLQVAATSTDPNAILTVYVTSTGQLIGTLTNNGGGNYSGQFFWPVNPQKITVKSNLGGSATKTVRTK